MDYTRAEAKSWAREKMVGHWSTMVTPFTPEGKLDEAGLRKNIRYVLSLGTEGIGFTWSYGEFWALTMSERKKIAEIAVDEIAGKALVGIHTFDACQQNCLELTKHAEATGADLAILMSPYIAKTDQQVYEYFKSVADKVKIGIAIYNNPVISGYLIPPGGIAKLADIENVVLTKEAYPQIHQILDVFKAAGDKIVVSSPNDEVYFYEPFYGIKQQVLFASEYDWMCDTPKQQPRRKFMKLIAKGDYAKAAEVYREKVLPIKEIRHKWFRMFQRQGLFPVHLGKYWGELMGMVGGPVRVPSIPLTPSEQKSLRADLEKVGLLKAGK